MLMTAMNCFSQTLSTVETTIVKEPIKDYIRKTAEILFIALFKQYQYLLLEVRRNIIINFKKSKI